MTGEGVNVAVMLEIFKAASVAAVLDAMAESCRAFGGDKFSYHPEVMFEGVASAKSDVYSKGFPDEWLDFYLNGGAQLIDPVPDLVMQIGKPITFLEATAMLDLSGPAMQYVETVRKLGLSAGMGFPLWGPLGQNAFVAVGFAEPDLVWTPTVIKSQHTLLLAGHQKIVELLPNTGNNPTLSKREIEVLTWMGKGKSNTDVGTILSISPETVATYIRRIFTKLECNDRIGAVIKALKMGLIRV